MVLVASMLMMSAHATAQASVSAEPSSKSSVEDATESNAPSMGGIFGGPLTVQPGDPAVVMEYEAWFGPHAISFYGNSEASPLLQTEDMEVGGCTEECGYDSENPHVIRRHISWLEYLGIDAVTLDDTNDVACIYDSKEFAEKHHLPGCSQWKSYWVHIGTNNAHLYSAWNELETPLKIIPLLGAADPLNFVRDPYDHGGHKTALEKEIDFYGNLMAKYPNMGVVYEGKPLVLLFIAVNASTVFPLVRDFLTDHPELTAKYTFRIMGGYFDSQSAYWAPPAEQKFWTNKQTNTPSGPTEIDSQYGFWSGGDRFNITCKTKACVSGKFPYDTYPFYPTYNMAGSRVESFAPGIATAGAYGWGTPGKYAPDASLRFDSQGHYSTFNSFMHLAVRLKPTFLLISQFNEFQKPDEGWDANTSNDMEPADLWGKTGIVAVHDWVVRYRKARKANSTKIVEGRCTDSERVPGQRLPETPISGPR